MDWKPDLDNAFSDLFKRRKLLVLLMSWLACLLALVAYRTIVGSPADFPRFVPADLSVLDRNETGPLVAWRKGLLVESPPDYKVEFDTLRAENGRLGFFRTASNKTASIDNLHVTLQQPENLNAQERGQDVRLKDFCDLFTPRRDEISRASQLGVFTDLQGEATDWTVSIDITNTTEVHVKDMVWEIRCGNRTALKIQCRRACLRGDIPYVLLQGHATVTTPTTTLEGNCIKMNVRDNCFVVDGRYLLTRGGRRQAGVGGCFDTELKPYQIASSDGKEQEEWTHEYLLGVF